MSRLQGLLNKNSQSELYIHCDEAIELIKLQNEEESYRIIGKVLAQNFFHFFMGEHSCSLHEVRHIFSPLNSKIPANDEFAAFEKFHQSQFSWEHQLWDVEAKQHRVSVITSAFIDNMVNENDIQYMDFNNYESYNLWWDRKKFFEFCYYYEILDKNGIFKKTIKDTLGSTANIDIIHDTYQERIETLESQLAEISQEKASIQNELSSIQSTKEYLQFLTIKEHRKISKEFNALIETVCQFHEEYKINPDLMQKKISTTYREKAGLPEAQGAVRRSEEVARLLKPDEININ